MTQTQTANNAKGQFLAGISSVATSFLMKWGMEARFPTHNWTTDKNYYLTAKKFWADGVSWIKQEIILITKRVWNQYTFSRSAWYCPATSEATEQTNTAFEFDADDYIEMTPVSEITQEMWDTINANYTTLDTNKAEDSEVVHNTGAGTVAGVKTFSSSPIVPTPTTDYQPATKKYVDDIVLWNVVKSLQNENLYVWEDIDARESIFDEDWPTFIEATGEQNIWDVSANKRVSTPVFGSWNFSNKEKLSLLKVWSPTNLWIRIETDNAWNPSWTLADANAIATVLASVLTTSLSDIIISMGANIDQNNSVVYDTSDSIAYKTWYKISFDKETKINTIIKDSSCTATTCYLMDSDKNILDTQTFSWDIATFDYWVDIADYFVMVDSGWSTYTSESKNTVSFPIDNDICDYEWGIKSFLNAHWETMVTGSSIPNYLWLKVVMTSEAVWFTVKRYTWVSATKCYLRSDAWAILETVPFIWNVATFTSTLANWTTYRIEAWSDWASYTRYVQSSPSFPYICPWLNITNWSNAWWDIADPYNIESITFVTEDANWYNIKKLNVVEPISLTEWEKFHLVAFQWTYWSETIDNANYYKIGYSTNNTTTRWLKLFDTSWSSVDADKFIYVSSDLFLNKILSKAAASYSYKLPQFPMITKEAKTIWNKIKYDFDWIVSWFTGLTEWEYYFISDTAGELDTTPWTNEFMFWLAISDTELLIRNDAKKAIWTSGWSATVTIWFYPRIVLVAVVWGWNAVFDESDISNKTATWFDINGAFDWVALG